MSKKMTTSIKKKHIKAARYKAKLFRANEPLISVFMWGVNHTINELSHIAVPAMLMPDDFKAFSKNKVDNHLFNKENMPSHYKVKEYCPLVFRNLRERFGIDDDEYLKSMTKFQPQDTDSPGRSGARFLYSYDKKFIIKTIDSEQVEEMHHILQEYHEHIVSRRGHTLLPQYLGMYRITVDSQEHYLLVMRNIFTARFKIHKKYDLKGSTVDRKASDKERGKELPTLKDVDFVDDKVQVNIGEDTHSKLLDTIRKDSQLLCKLNLMDYSLLLGIHDIERGIQEQQEAIEKQQEQRNNGQQDGAGGAGAGSSGGAVGGVSSGGDDDWAAVGGDDSEDGTPPDSPNIIGPTVEEVYKADIDNITPYVVKCQPDCERKELYFMGIIDILTHYGMKKRAAQAAKTVKHGSEAAENISTTDPDRYAKRFIDFIEHELLKSS